MNHPGLYAASGDKRALYLTTLERYIEAGRLPKLASAILHSLALRSRAGDSRASLRATAVAGVALLCGNAGS
ncbi:hypothetical protein [Paraburkholderia fungorum]|uniref:hypothetical protein n=1 Tax=Paraburkholderia fungorum TaxID=134537 RepID=UPI0020A7F1E5|nr:hypothetical protein [Paraburkholderia fungorum]